MKLLLTSLNIIGKDSPILILRQWKGTVTIEIALNFIWRQTLFLFILFLDNTVNRVHGEVSFPYAYLSNHLLLLMFHIFTQSGELVSQFYVIYISNSISIIIYVTF